MNAGRPDTPQPNDDRMLDELRAANPIPPTTASSPDDARAARAAALFQEITMSDPNVTTAPRPAAAASPFSPPPSREAAAAKRAPRKAPRRIGLGAAAAATAAILGFGAVSLIPGSVTPAAAAMIDAAEQTQAADSGTIIVTLNVSDVDEAGTLSLVTDFSGDDLAARLDASREFGFDGNTPEIRIVDDVIYLNEGTSWFAVEDERIMSLIATFGLPTDVRQTMSEGVVDLLELADNAVETEDGNFTATVTAADIQTVAEGYPAFGLVAGEALPAEVADHELDLAVVLDDAGLIDTVTLSGTDTDETGEYHADVTIDFDNLDAGAVIEAPADAESLDFGDLSGD